jgi:hypothetical protein
VRRSNLSEFTPLAKKFNLVYMNFHTRKTLEVIEPKIQKIFQINVDDIPGGPIHRFHQDPKKVKSILKNLFALPHQEDFEFGDVFF